MFKNDPGAWVYEDQNVSVRMYDDKHGKTYMCKWCGTRYCKECLRGEFVGEMSDPNKCRVCNQTRCQGQRVEYVPRQNKEEEDGKVKKRGTSAISSRSRSAKSVKSNKSGKSKKSGKKSSGKKKKKRK